MSMIVNRRDISFYLREFLDLESMLKLDRYREYDDVAVDMILDTAQAIAEREFLPFASKLDVNEPHFDGERVDIIPEVENALKAFQEAGFFGAGFSQDLGGLGLPQVIALAAQGMFSAANQGVASYPFLTKAAANMLNESGSDWQIEKFVKRMVAGDWFGTMCLSEPQAGSSLSDIQTKAKPEGDGYFLIEGSKMWISAGDHELSKNIVHMVLAKIPGGPPGVKGISLFIVPKYQVNPDGSLGGFNNVSLAGLNHKMGHRGTTNCLLNFGERGPCVGYLVGERHRGLQYMFRMMNEARVGVGYGSAMSALSGFLYSLEYARNRPQGRHPDSKDPDSPQVMLSEHADIRRMLLAQKAYVEGAIALQYYCTALLEPELSNDPVSQNALLDVLTPIAKSWPSEYCLEANKLAIQILGGYGYTREYPVERFYRDNRLNHIHEGTHGIQGIDFLGRKVVMENGRALKILVDEITRTVSEANESEALSVHADSLHSAVRALSRTVELLSHSCNERTRLANATLFLDASGHVVIAWIWLKQAIAAMRGLSKGAEADKSFYDGKLRACDYFFTYELPKVYQVFGLVGSLDEICLRADEKEFLGN